MTIGLVRLFLPWALSLHKHLGVAERRAYGEEQKDKQARPAEKEKTSPEIGHSFRPNQPAFRTGYEAPDWTIWRRGGTATYEKVKPRARQLLRL
jgi:hypothetical protein